MDRQRLLADLLRRTADAIDQGTCTVTNAQASMIIDELMNRPMSKEQASIYMGMGRSSFDKAVRDGVIPRGRKVAGFKELLWFSRGLKTVASSSRRKSL